MNNPTKHTPGPWTVSNESSAYMEGTIIIGPDGIHEIAGVWKAADAAYIVQCVNAYKEEL